MSNMRQKDLRPAPALIEFKGMKFLITDRPSDVTIHHYIMVSRLGNRFEIKNTNLAPLPFAGIKEKQCEYCGSRLRAQLQHRRIGSTRHHR